MESLFDKTITLGEAIAIALVILAPIIGLSLRKLWHLWERTHYIELWYPPTYPPSEGTNTREHKSLCITAGPDAVVFLMGIVFQRSTNLQNFDIRFVDTHKYNNVPSETITLDDTYDCQLQDSFSIDTPTRLGAVYSHAVQPNARGGLNVHYSPGMPKRAEESLYFYVKIIAPSAWNGFLSLRTPWKGKDAFSRVPFEVIAESEVK